MPLLTFTISALLYFVTLVTRNHLIGDSITIIPNNNGWIALVVVLVIFMGVICACNLSTEKFIYRSKTGALIADIALLLFVASIMILGYFNGILHIDENYDYGANTVVPIAAACGGVMIILVIVFYIIYSDRGNKKLALKEELEKIALEKENDVLLEMYNFSKDILESKGYELTQVVEKIVEVPVEKIVEVQVEKIVEVPVEPKPVEEVVEEVVEEKVTEPEVVEVDVPIEKVRKEIEPSPKKILKYVQNNFTDTVIVVEEDDVSFKAYRGKKMFINLAVGANDYRITFQRKPISITRLLVKYPTITKAKTPAGDQWFKLVNKGNFEESDLQNIIKFSYNYLINEEQKALLKKQKEKEKAAEKRKKEKEKAKLAAQKEKEKK